MTRKVNFKTNSRHISQLGRELVTDFVTALTELIKNSYDADAEGVKIIFDKIKTDNGKIMIIDTGSGMTQSDVENKWMVIGTNNKVRDNYSPLGRKRVGKKGIGRFSVERLAEKVCIYSFTEYEKPFKFSINWNKYEEINVNFLEQKITILRNTQDEDSAKYIKTQLEYVLLSDKVQERDKKIIKDKLEFDERNYRIFFEQKKLDILEKDIIPILKKYENIEERIDEIYNEIELLQTDEENQIETYLKDYYNELGIKRETITGTVIVLDNLRDTWKDKHIKRLQKELRQLVAPEFIEKNAFKIKMIAPEFKVEDTTLVNDILDARFATVKAKLIENGRRMIIEYIERVSEDYRKVDKILDTPKLCGDVELELYYFVRDSRNLFTDAMSFTEIRKLLDIYCGIKIYRDNFRVKPYGDMGNDWLLLDQEKIKSTHGYLVGNNQTIGVVRITEEKNGMLIDATNREGIIENEAYEDLKSFVKECTTMISNIRYEKFEQEKNEKDKDILKKEEERKQEEEKVIDVIESQKEEYSKLEKLINSEDLKDEESIKKLINLSKELKDSSEKSVEETKKSLEKSQEYAKEIKDIYESKMEDTKEEASLYKDLASLGVLSAEFGHETKDVASRTKRNIELLNNYIGKDEERCKRYLGILTKDLDRILSYIDIINGFILKNKRNQTDIKLREAIKEITNLYEMLIKEYNIKVKFDCDEDITYRMSMLDLESILINLFTNAFVQVKKVEKRIIFIKIEDNINNICIRFIDSGNGIKNISEEEIFMPFRTTKENGIGLGMCIVKSVIEKYKGSIAVGKSQEYGGAEFIIELPKEE